MDIPAFQEEGLGKNLYSSREEWVGEEEVEIRYFEPMYEGHTNWRATELFFELEERDAMKLFSSTAYRFGATADMVVAPTLS